MRPIQTIINTILPMLGAPQKSGVRSPWSVGDNHAVEPTALECRSLETSFPRAGLTARIWCGHLLCRAAITRNGATLGIGLLIVLLSGCLINSSPAARTFLPALPEQAASAKAAITAEKSTLLVARVELPRYLDRPEIALRKGSVEIVYAPFSHWAQPLDLACTSLLAQALRSSLADRTVKAYPDVTADGTDRLNVRFERFEATDTGAVVAEAAWSLISGNGGTPTRSGTFSAEVKTDPSDMVSIARAHGQILSQLADDISKSLTGTAP